MIEMTLRSAFIAGLWACAAAPALAQTSTVSVTAAPMAANSNSSPTRMQRCQSEIASLQGATRKRVLRECLVGRAEGERLIGRDCSRQYRSLPAGQTIDKATYIKQCSAQSLNVGHKELPKSKPAAPAASASAALVATGGANAQGKTVPASAAKPQDKPAAKPVAKPNPPASKAN